jgi:hypothetical protein
MPANVTMVSPGLIMLVQKHSVHWPIHVIVQNYQGHPRNDVWAPILEGHHSSEADPVSILAAHVTKSEIRIAVMYTEQIISLLSISKKEYFSIKVPDKFSVFQNLLLYNRIGKLFKIYPLKIWVE